MLIKLIQVKGSVEKDSGGFKLKTWHVLYVFIY